MAKKALYQIRVDGLDVSSRWNPILQSIEIEYSDTDVAGKCSIILDDRESRIQWPSVGGYLTVDLGWQKDGLAGVFDGTIDEIRSQGARGSGQIMMVSAKGIDTTGQIKQQGEVHSDAKTFGDAAQELAKGSGVTDVQVSEELRSITRDWWARQNESFMQWGTRIAKEIGASFVVNGETAAFTKLTGDQSGSGQKMQQVKAEKGKNLFAWDIAPILSRPRFSKTATRWFDIAKPGWGIEQSDTNGFQTGEATFTNRTTQADQDSAQVQAGADADDSARNAGEGTVDIDGNNTAQPGGTCLIVGVREGVDGSYRMVTVRHGVDRSSGWVTRLELKQPKQSSTV